MKPFELIEGAASLIERTGWTQGRLACDANGNRLGVPGFERDPPAACYCAYGALCRVSWDSRKPVINDDLLSKTFDVAIDALNAACGYSIAGFNDTHGRTKEEVLALMRETAAKLREEETT